jgi:hemerythrin-like domain-containing protein
MPRFTIQAIREDHAALAAMLRSLLLMIDQGPEQQPERFFDVLRAMLFYIDEFPERQHHPKESRLLFPKVAAADPGLAHVIHRLEADHMQGENQVRELQHLVLAWELLGDTRRRAFCGAARDYVRFYLDHMRVEETQILPAAQRALSDSDWDELDAAFRADRDPLATGVVPAGYDRLFTRIVMAAPAPIGLGEAGTVTN